MARERILTRDVMLEQTRELLLEAGYERFTFSLLAERLDVSRGAIYKYYANKDALLMDYMLHHMERFVRDLQFMDEEPDFSTQFQQLIELLYEHSEIHQILKTAEQIPLHNEVKTEETTKRFYELLDEMKERIRSFISLGKKNDCIRQEIPDEIIFLFLHQLVEIPAAHGITREEWLKHVTEILKRGMFTIPY